MAQFSPIEAEDAQNLFIKRELLEALIERLVDLLDCIDGDADFEADFDNEDDGCGEEADFDDEDDGCGEPLLSWSETINQEFPIHTFDDDVPVLTIQMADGRVFERRSR